MKGGTTMQLLKSKRLMLLLITLAAIFAFSITTSLAQEKVKTKRKDYGVMVKYETIKVDDIEGHALNSYESRGVGSAEEGTFSSKGQSDLTKGNGTHQGYYKNTDKDGNVFFSKWQGKVSTTQSPEGKPIMKWEGTFSYVKGTGKWENIQGGGTYKGGFIARGIYVNYVEGEYFIKK
jgi:hypothetical protein